jgi:hypothetical protein
METPAFRPTTIVAVTSEEPRHDPVRRRAAAIAKDAGSTVILWARDAAVSPLESPLPTAWSGDGEREQFGDRLGPNDLIAAGFEPLARQVGELRKAGLDAWGWLPDKADAEHLMTYAADEKAELVLVSTDDADLIADLRDAEAHDAVAKDRRRPKVEAVPG